MVAGGELHLLFLGEQFVAAHFGEILLERVGRDETRRFGGWKGLRAVILLLLLRALRNRFGGLDPFIFEVGKIDFRDIALLLL